ncbi:TPA: ABC transporter [Candidatus Sumerlaeota bacterium]|jgi:oligopeptide transport system permease protein|nr:ABC transporter [Candidatus Sumerlaeota bacterium]
MYKFLARRLLFFIPVLYLTATAVFFLVRVAPGGPFDAEKPPSAAALEQLKKHYMLDAPLWKQYGFYLINLCKGDLGASMNNPTRTVSETIASGFPVSAELGVWALCWALAVGLTAGIVAGIRPHSWLDNIPMSLSMTGICIPSFVLGPLLVLVFSLKWRIFPVQGWNGMLCRVLPAITLGAGCAAYIARLTRGAMLETLSQDFIRTARAKGLTETQVVLRHALRASLTPVASFLGPAAAGLLTGSFVVETVFQIPGLGREFVRSAFNRDYTMTLGLSLFYAALILIFNLLSDLLQSWLDPRARNS